MKAYRPRPTASLLWFNMVGRTQRLVSPGWAYVALRKSSQIYPAPGGVLIQESMVEQAAMNGSRDRVH